MWYFNCLGIDRADLGITDNFWNFEKYFNTFEGVLFQVSMGKTGTQLEIVASDQNRSEKTVNFFRLSTILLRSKETTYLKFNLYEKEGCSLFHYLIQIFVWLHIWLLYLALLTSLITQSSKKVTMVDVVFCFVWNLHSTLIKICSSRRTCKCMNYLFRSTLNSTQQCFSLHFFCIEIMNDIKQNHHHENEGLNY